jgi:hypothetical protein
MYFKTVYFGLPVLIFSCPYLPKCIKWLHFGMIILINPNAAGQLNSLIAYQLICAKQWYRSCGLSDLLRLLPKFRLRYKCEAYAAQIKSHSDPVLEQQQYLRALAQLEFNEISQIDFKQKKQCLNYFLNCYEPQLAL